MCTTRDVLCLTVCAYTRNARRSLSEPFGRRGIPAPSKVRGETRRKAPSQERRRRTTRVTHAERSAAATSRAHTSHGNVSTSPRAVALKRTHTHPWRRAPRCPPSRASPTLAASVLASPRGRLDSRAARSRCRDARSSRLAFARSSLPRAPLRCVHVASRVVARSRGVIRRGTTVTPATHATRVHRPPSDKLAPTFSHPSLASDARAAAVAVAPPAAIATRDVVLRTPRRATGAVAPRGDRARARRAARRRSPRAR